MDSIEERVSHGFQGRVKGGREGRTFSGADIFSPITHACPLRDFLKFNLHPGIFDQPAKNQFFTRRSVYTNRNSRSTLR